MNTMNKQQKNYIMAKAILEILEAKEDKIDHDYIIKNNIIDSDGSIPEYCWYIKDEKLFDKVNHEIADIVESSGLWDNILKARENLKQAENDLISYGLTIIPVKMEKERKTLENECKTNYTNRMKIIDLVMKLDVRTVK